MARFVSSAGVCFASAALVALGGCGGGGGDDAPVATSAPPPVTTPPVVSPPPPSKVVLTGVAATGAPFEGATLTVVDPAGTTVCETTTDSQGAYACEMAAGTQAPLVLTASRGDQAFYGISATGTGRANVTPLTTVIASRLSPDGNPANLANAIRTRPATVNAAAIAQQEGVLQTMLQPLLGAVGDTISPLTGTFAADGTGHDRVLDSLAVSVRPDGQAANIEMIVKTVPSGGVVAPVSLNFRSNETAPAALPVTVTAASLPPAGLSQAVSAFLARLTACYALPLSQRVNAASDAVSVTGGAADVKAPVCRSVFVGDDPSTYLSGGSRVGRDAFNNGSFSGLFRPGSTGVVFDRGVQAFYRANGDFAITYRTVSAGGAEENQTLVVRDVGGTIKAIGNQYIYNASVTAFVQERDYINQTAYTWRGTGYDVFISNRVDAQGRPVFAKVVVTLPNQTTLEFLPTPGLSFLVAKRAADGFVSTTSVVRLAGGFRDKATPGNPAALEPNLFMLPAQIDDEAINAIGDQSVWRMEFFHADASLSNVVQNYRTVSRPFTLAEAETKAFAELTPTMRSEYVAATSAAQRLQFGPASASRPNVVNVATAANQDAWTVPFGATAPTLVTVFGRPVVNGVQGALFNDSVSVASTARKAQVTCLPQTAADPHCDASTGVLQFAPTTRITTVQLGGTNARMVGFNKQIHFYRLVP